MATLFFDILKRGSIVMRSNSRLILVGFLLFAFPLLFVQVTQNFFETSYHNINTAEKKRVGILNDSLAVTLQTAANPPEMIPALISSYKQEDSSLTKIKIVRDTGEELVVDYSSDESLIGNLEKSDRLYRSLPLNDINGNYIVETIIDGVRTWQVFRGVEVGSTSYYIFAEYKFSVIDNVMAARRQQSYYGLTAIFIFLIALAYWLNRQTEWHKNHQRLAMQLEERDMFSNMIAHEFRSPLTAIKGYASFLEESGKIDNDELRFARNIRKSAERLVTLVNDFLEVARLQSGKISIERKNISINSLLQSIVDDLQVIAVEKNLKLVFIKPKTNITVSIDPNRMIQVMTNIITNAIKYTDSGSVEIECEKIPGEFTISVKDTGTGISAEDQQKLFAPFTRVGGVDSANTTGTGLGMWITRQLVVLLDGKIGVESIKGIGTRVVISFKI